MHLRQAISRLFLNGKTSPSVVNGARLFSANSGGGEGRNGWDNVVGWDSDSIRASDAKENPEVYTIEKLAKDYRIMRQRVHAILWLKQIEEEEENKLGWDSDSIRASDAKENPEVYTIEKLAKDYRIMRQRVHAILWLKQIEEEEEKKLGHPLDDSVELLLDTCPDYCGTT